MSGDNSRRRPVRQIIKAAGGADKVAQILGIYRSAVYQWKKVPVTRAQAMSKLSGYPLWEIRPDVWECPTQSSEAA